MVKIVRSNQSEVPLGSSYVTTLLASVEYHSVNKVARLIEDPNLHGDESFIKLVISSDFENKEGVVSTLSIIRTVVDTDTGTERSVYSTYPVEFSEEGKLTVAQDYYIQDTALLTIVPFMVDWLEELVTTAKGLVFDLSESAKETQEELQEEALNSSASAEASTSESLSLSAYLSTSLSESISHSESLRQSQLAYLSECSESLAQSVSAYATSVEESVQNSLNVIESEVLSSLKQSLSEFKVGVSAAIEHSLTTYRSMVEDSYTSVSESLENDLKVIQSVEGSWSGGVVETSREELVSSDILLDSDSEEVLLDSNSEEVLLDSNSEEVLSDSNSEEVLSDSNSEEVLLDSNSEEEVVVDLDDLIATLREEETSRPKKEFGLSLDFAKDFSESVSEKVEDTAQLESNEFEDIEKSLDKLWESKDKPAKGLKKFVSPLLGKGKKNTKKKSKKEESNVVEDNVSKLKEETSPKKKSNKGYQAPATKVGGVSLGNGTYQVTFDE